MDNTQQQQPPSGYAVREQSTAVQGVTDGQQLGSRIGHIVMYSIPSDFDHSLQAIREAVEDEGLSFGPFLVYSPNDAFLKAVDSVRNSQKTDRSIFVRKAARSIDFRKYQLTIEYRQGEMDDEDASLNYERELFITLRDPNEKKGKAKLEFDSVNHVDIQDTILSVYNHARGHGDRYQFSRWAQHHIHEMSAVSMRSRGGVWFVAEQFTHRIEAVQAVFNYFGASFYSFPLFQTTSDEVFETTESVVLRDLRKFQETVDDLRQKANEEGKPLSTRQLTTRRKALDKMLVRIEVVEDLLSMQSTRIADVVSDIETLMDDAAREPSEIISEEKTLEYEAREEPVGFDPDLDSVPEVIDAQIEDTPADPSKFPKPDRDAFTSTGFMPQTDDNSPF